MSKYFDEIDPIKFEGRDSENPLAFKYYDSSKILMGKSMEEHLRFAVCYWHNFCWDGFDIFGSGTFNRPWHGVTNDQAAAEAKLEAAFSFFNKLGNPYFCFHDTDVMAAAETPKEHVENFAAIVDKIEEKMSGIKDKASLGYGEYVFSPALHGRRFNQSKSGCCCFCCFASQALSRSDSSIGW